MDRKYWTKERNEEIAQCYVAGESTGKIGQKFDLTRQRVSQILKSQDIIIRQQQREVRPCSGCGAPVEHFINGYFHKGYTRCFDCVAIWKVNRKTIWAPKWQLKACKGCHKCDVKHVSGGLCVRCYQKQRYKDPVYRERHKAFMRAYNGKNRERILTNMRNYQTKRKQDLQEMFENLE